MSKSATYVAPAIHSFSSDDVRDMLGPVTCQYTTTTVMLPTLPAESGSVVSLPPLPNTPVPIVATAGDGLKLPPVIGPDTLSQAFLGFDISGIPSTATVTAATLALTPTAPQVVGSPFTDLGSLVISSYDYGALDATDFGVLGTPIGTALSFPVSQSAVAEVQAAVTLASPRFKVTLYFGAPTNTDGNNDLDQVVLTPADALLTVTYL